MNITNNNEEENAIAYIIDGQLIANAVTATQHISGELPQNEFLIFEGLGETEGEELILFASKQKVELN